MEASNEKKPRGRPNNSFSKQKSAPFRAAIAARRIKSFSIENACLRTPQADLVSKSLDDLITPSMFANYWKGKNSPCKTTTLPKLAKRGLDLEPLFTSVDDVYKKGTTNHVVRHMLAIDMYSPQKHSDKAARSTARILLNDIDSDWTPSDERIFFTEPQEESFRDKLRRIEGEEYVKKWDEEWDAEFPSKKTMFSPPLSKWSVTPFQLHPSRKRMDRNLLRNYDPFDSLSLLSWLLSIAPFYYSTPSDLERLTLDLLTTSMCLTTLSVTSNSKNLGSPARSHRRSCYSGIPAIALLKSPMIDPYLRDWAQDFPDLLPTSKPNKTSGLKVVAENIYGCYDNWLKNNGLSRQEMAIAMDFCDLEIAQKLKLFNY